VAQLRQDNWRKRAKPAKSRAMRFVGKIAKESELKKRRGRKPSDKTD
jgi:hypothetical protein